jgi:hypothetical protein
VNGKNVSLALQTKSSQFQLVLISLLKYKGDCLVELMLLDGQLKDWKKLINITKFKFEELKYKIDVLNL